MQLLTVQYIHNQVFRALLYYYYYLLCMHVVIVLCNYVYIHISSLSCTAVLFYVSRCIYIHYVHEHACIFIRRLR